MTSEFPDKQTLHRQVLGQWEAAITAGDFEKAVRLDNFHYDNLVKRTEDVGYWDKWQSDTLASRNRLSALFDTISPLQIPPPQAGKNFSIVFHNFSGLAHETQLARNLTYLRQRVQTFEFDIVYLFGNVPGSRERAQEIYDIKADAIHFLSATSYENAGQKLEMLVQRQAYQSILYPSIFWMAYWMSLFVSHGNQKFLQMKYYPLHAGRIQSWAGGQRNDDDFYSIRGCAFEQLPVLDLKLSGAVGTSASAEVISEKVTIGSISRPEKIANADYNDFIKSLLDQHTDWLYLYTGRPESLSLLPEIIRKHPQARALGWVDPLQVINKFSIYLEPFPWGGGDMTLLALESGRAYLTLETEESLRFGIYPFIQIIANNRDEILQFSFCKSLEQLKERLLILAANPELRNQLGDAWRRAIAEYQPRGVERWVDFLLR
jgi:glycosyltransferase involved in cell wall biosynthesis